MADHSGSGRDPARARGEELSALLDGELQGAPVERICSEWRANAHSRDTWHAYSLIGDVMRCEDLAHSCAHDEQFLRDLRRRMASEPVVLAPQAARSPSPKGVAGAESSPLARPVRSWAWPMAWAAAFVAVVGVVVGVQNPAVTATAEPVVALAPAVEHRPLVKVARAENAMPPPDADAANMELVFDGQVIRDPRLDRYLLAHKQFAGTSVLGPASGMLRNAVVEVPAR